MYSLTVEDAFLVPDEVPSSELPDVDVLAVRSEWKEWLLMGSSSRRLVSARRVFLILNVGVHARSRRMPRKMFLRTKACRLLRSFGDDMPPCRLRWRSSVDWAPICDRGLVLRMCCT